MNKIILTFLTIFGLSISVKAAERETWLCDGFLYTDNSQGNPFIMYGDGKRYEWKDVENDHEHEINYVAQGWVGNFDVFVGGSNPKNSYAYYIQTAKHPVQKQRWKGNKMMIMSFSPPLHFDMPNYPSSDPQHLEEGYYSTTSCIKQ